MIEKIYFKNNIWDIKSILASNENDAYCCPNNSHPFVLWTFKIQRHAGLFEATYIAPAFG